MSLVVDECQTLLLTVTIATGSYITVGNACK